MCTAPSSPVRGGDRECILLPVVGGWLTSGTGQSLAHVDLNVEEPSRSIRLTFLSG